jgi:Skp family chaperone for outer membrane proteins
MKTLMSLVAIAAMVPAVAVERRPAPSIAYVSLQQISNQTAGAKTAAARLDKARQERTREIAAKQREIEATHLKLVNAGGIFQSSTRAQLRAQEDRQRAELQHLTQQAQTDLQTLQRDLQNGLRQRITAVLDDIAAKRGLQIVLNQDSAVVWAPAGADLTAQVIDRLNSENTGK